MRQLVFGCLVLCSSLVFHQSLVQCIQAVLCPARKRLGRLDYLAMWNVFKFLLVSKTIFACQCFFRVLVVDLQLVLWRLNNVFQFPFFLVVSSFMYVFDWSMLLFLNSFSYTNVYDVPFWALRLGQMWAHQCAASLYLIFLCFIQKVQIFTCVLHTSGLAANHVNDAFVVSF